jgi:hypothetical protein
VDAIDVNRCALVLVDYQAKLMPAIHDAEDVVRCAVLLAEAGMFLAFAWWVPSRRKVAQEGIWAGSVIIFLEPHVEGA